VLLDRTAVDTEDLQCGGTAGDNNVFGEGRLDAAALVAAAPPAEGGTTVDRVDGATRYDTAAMIWDDLAPGIDVAYVASGANFPDALAGAARAGSEGAPVLLTRPDRLPAATAAALSRLDPARVVILGGSGAVSEAVLQEIQVTTEGAPVSRVDGVDRYDTAALLAPETPVGTVVVASGEDFPDSCARTRCRRGRPRGSRRSTRRRSCCWEVRSRCQPLSRRSWRPTGR
jgi:putative cell wall-binding protein